MGFRFWRRIKLAPGVTLNLSKSGGSLSFGPRGAKVTLGGRSGLRRTVGIPGTGLFYTTTGGGSRGARSSHARSHPQPQVRAGDRLSLGFFKRLFTPQEEEDLVDGMKQVVLGHERVALEHLRKASHLADGAFLAGFLSLKLKLYEEAVEHLHRALDRSGELGTYFRKYGVDALMSLPVTEEITVHIAPGFKGVVLVLGETLQAMGRMEDAIRALVIAYEADPEDLMLRLSLAELLLEARGEDRTALDEVVRLAGGVDNESPVHAALLYYKGRALHALGLTEAARDAFTASLRRRKDYPEELLKAARYERARVYEEMGQRSRARQEFGRLYSEDPGYEDVAERMGVTG